MTSAPGAARSRIINLLLALGSILLTLGIAEIGLRLFSPSALRTARYQRYCNTLQWDERFTRFDPDLGWMTRPHLDLPFSNPEFTVQVRTNSEGFRDDEDSLKDPDILLLGDSFAFGWGVEQEETAAAILERRSGRKVLNMGVSGQDWVQHVLLLQATAETLSTTGATVLLVHSPKSATVPSFESLAGPAVRKEGVHLAFAPVPEEAFRDNLRSFTPGAATRVSAYSSLADTFFGESLTARHAGDLKSLETGSSGDDLPGIILSPAEVMEYTLRVARLFASEREMRIGVVLVPAADAASVAERKNRHTLCRRILEMLEIPHLDLGEHFSESDFFPMDRHLNPEGQRKLGEKIADWLASLEATTGETTP